MVEGLGVYIYIYIYIYIRTCVTILNAQSAGAVEHTKECPDMTLKLLWLGCSNAGALGMQNTHSLPTLPGPLCLGVEAPDRVLSMGQIELICVLNAKLNCLKSDCTPSVPPPKILMGCPTKLK